MRHLLSAGSLAAALCSTSLAAWSVRYEINDGNGWTNSFSANISREPLTLDFRIVVSLTGPTTVQTNAGTATALTPQRLCNSQRVTNFGGAGSGDQILSFVRSVSSGNDAGLARSQSGADTILGTPNAATSFAGDLSYAIANPHPARADTEFYRGRLVIGNATAGAKERTITLTANTFAYPSATAMFGGAFGASFLTTVNDPTYGVAMGPAVVVPATIVIHTPHCAEDLNNDGFVLDDDFQIFVMAFDLLACADEAMPAGCPADFNHDGFVDEADFMLFAPAYNGLACP